MTYTTITYTSTTMHHTRDRCITYTGELHSYSLVYPIIKKSFRGCVNVIKPQIITDVVLLQYLTLYIYYNTYTVQHIWLVMFPYHLIRIRLLCGIPFRSMQLPPER